MNQPAKQPGMRERMPDTAQWIDARRLEWGKAHVDDCLRRATVDKEPGHFYAIERGHVAGTPFAADHEVAELQRYAVLHACTFAAFMREPVPVQTSAQGGGHAN
ncbi:hypothetical protein [Variovorax sp. UMC13]|uniref:hypothetical protein n=1 Tax=Variovorax sp. UMC13 TaxID=1862326 RepID=UPI001603D6AD|nr:hypothetical protein [Variovorax sp. UMC13]